MEKDVKHMMTKDRITLNNILQHKEHFDQRLIGIVEYLERQNVHLNMECKRITVNNQKLIKKNQDAQVRLKDLTTIQYNLNQKLKEKDEEISDIIKDFEAEIKEQEKIIKGELQHSYNENNKLHNENEKLRREIEKLRRENNRYKRMSKKNSCNSSIPPSMDEFRKVANSRIRTGLKKGGQKEHKVHRISLKETADKILYKIVSKAPAGAEAVLNEENEILYYRTQEIDARLKTEITETRYIIAVQGQALPEKEMRRYRISSVSYHDDFKAMILYLNSKGTIPLNRLCTMINEMSMGKINLSASVIVKWEEVFHQKSISYQNEILKELRKERILHVDETGWKINGKRAWLHVIVSEHRAFFIVTEKRKDTKKGPLGILNDYEGCLIHDHYKAYYDLKSCDHGECNAHILRYLKEGAELDKNEACAEMMELIQSMIHEKKELIRQGIMKMDEKQIWSYEKRYLDILNQELETYAVEHPKKVKAKYVPGYIKLMRRMVEYKEEHLRFIKDFTVPSDNNIAERQMRPTKAKKKISGQSLSLETANNFAAMHTVIQTCSLQGKNTLEEIKAILLS